MKFQGRSVNFRGAKTQPVTRLPVRKKAKKKNLAFFSFCHVTPFFAFSLYDRAWC